MLFREKLYLANCDSTRRLQVDEVRKRVMLGLIFAEGVVLTPNIILDNNGFDSVLSQFGVKKYLNEEGRGKLVVRGFGLTPSSTLRDYFDALPPNFVISNFNFMTKAALTNEQRDLILRRIDGLDERLRQANAVFEPVAPGADLSTEIRSRLSGSHASLFPEPEELERFLDGAAGLVSRSDWYGYVESLFQAGSERAATIKSELIDPAYNSLFINEREAFAQDRMRILEDIPQRLLEPAVVIRSLRREWDLLQYPLKIFQLVTTAGADAFIDFLTDEALSYLEDVAGNFVSRRNWFGMYPKLQKHIGIEVK